MGEKSSDDKRTLTLFLCGDVMTGRGIDQVLPYPSLPQLYEPYMKSAKGYVQLAEAVNGPIPKPVDSAYIWGDALQEFEHISPDMRIINLETAVTASDDFWPGKGIHYRMHPGNIACLTVAKIDCCVLANNHVLDWGYTGLSETLKSLANAHLNYAGCGGNIAAAEAPAIIDIAGKGRVIIFGCGSESSGIPPPWAARDDWPGINLLPDLSEATVQHLAERIAEIKQPGDLVVVSIHWGSNWGYLVPPEQSEFAHRLIDLAQVDVVHGHSSHHPKGIELYHGKLILYGCGDFINDYEGIAGYEGFRGDLSLMYFATLDCASGELLNLVMTPMQTKRFRLHSATQEDARLLQEILRKESHLSDKRIRLLDERRIIVGKPG